MLKFFLISVLFLVSCSYLMPGKTYKATDIKQIPIGWVLWSPAEDYIAVTAISVEQGLSTIYLVNSESGTVRELPQISSFNSVHAVDWSPDGRSLYFRAFSRFEDTKPIWSIWSIDVQESDSSPVYLMDAQWISWSDSGALAIVREDRVSQVSQIYVVYPNQSTEHLIYEVENYLINQISWSSAENSLAIVASDEPTRRTHSLMVLGLIENDLSIIETSISSVQVDWYADSPWIGYISSTYLEGIRKSIMKIVESENHCRLQIPNTEGYSSLSWSPTGELIAVVQNGELLIKASKELFPDQWEILANNCRQ